MTGIQKTPNVFSRFYLPIQNLSNQNLNKFRERNTLRSEIDSSAEVLNREIVPFVDLGSLIQKYTFSVEGQITLQINISGLMK